MKLIDADALKIEIACLHGADYQTIHYLNHAPTVDAVPVIRCKDCYAYECQKGDDFGVCKVWMNNTAEDGYCHHGG